MVELDFRQIRSHDGSRDNGFEELVCQLAHLSPPENADYFVRKEGAGGDAGVECYWKLKDGSEHAWQAKYFLDSLDASQWTQISKSVETALNKHPKLTKYYVCLPRDWTDSRKSGRGGKQVKSAWDKREEHVEKWNGLAKAKGMEVEFVSWCKHDLSLLLQRDDPQFAGRAHYWFGSPILTSDVFSAQAERSRNSLGERYTPEFHLDLPIAKVFDALARSKPWWDELEGQVNAWGNAATDARQIIDMVEKDSPETQKLNIQNEIESLSEQLIDSIISKTFIGQMREFKLSVKELDQKLTQISGQLLKIEERETKEDEENRYRRSLFYKFRSETESFADYLESTMCRVASKRCVLLEGEAGIGKSHLLCDVTMKRLDVNLPTVFLLGQHYQGGNPLQTLEDSLDLNSISHKEFLGALDASGEACGSNALIIVDAINEGEHRDDWMNQMAAFLTDILRFPHLSVVLSCRNTYLEYLVQDELIENPLVKVHHSGFRGYEHRAAAKYLSAQGISKPSAPITAPEFSNPLFLKTCCKALKSNGQTSFPKGLHGISSLFDFYIDSMEKIVSKKKRYRPSEHIVKRSLELLADHLYPEHLFGLPLQAARQLINGVDPNPNYGEYLFDILIQEGVISEDIAYNGETERWDVPVVRFTYERFSDHFVAKNIVKNVSEDALSDLFKPKGLLGKFFDDANHYSKAGILGHLSIIIAEKWGQEVIDLLPDEISKDSWMFENVFTGTLLWRSGDSFSDRTLELLNKVSGHGYHSPSIDILLALSSEPSHPWNADLLHKNLARMPMPERDSFWSTHIAISDYEEEDYENESVLRSLIDWAHSGVMDGVEEERIRLCVTVLLWMTSSSNRRVRDQATKSAVRVLSLYPELLEGTLKQFCDIDDLYIVERLYAVAYGVVLNVENESVIRRTANIVFTNLFASGRPTPHFLLRDYASGIMEFAYSRGLLDAQINPDDFKPPYSSEWPLPDPTEDELDDLVGDKYKSLIRSSIMGFPGDFGNYTMSCIHSWNPTPIGNGKPYTAYEHQLKFSEALEGELKERFLAYINSNKEAEEQPFDDEALLRILKKVEIVEANAEKEPTEYDLLKDEIEASLNPIEKENFRWVMGLGRMGSAGSYSRKKAQRWVCKRAIDIGWSKELFEEFEKHHAANWDRSTSKIERIGKKYQWIALHEFLAHLSDNCCYIDPGYSDVDYSKYFGPWQLHERNIDPTCWLRKTGDDGWGKWTREYWWQPYVFPFYGESLEELREWLWDEELIPPFEKLLQVQDPVSKESWYVLKSFASWVQKPKHDGENIPKQDGWYRINSCIIEKGKVELLEKAVEGRSLCDPHVLSSNSNGHQGFLKEYPWHPVYKDMTGWSEDRIGFGLKDGIRHFVPTSIYEWESGSTDMSIDSSISIRLPSKELVDALDLTHAPDFFGQWKNREGEVVFYDPNALQDGPSAGLIRSEELFNWLESEGLQLIWLVGGEKQLFTSMATKFFGRLVYSGIYKLSKDGISGKNWFIREEPVE